MAEEQEVVTKSKKNTDSGVTMEQLFQILAKMNEQQQENMMKFAAELKKPTEREQREIDAKDRRIAEQQSNRIKLAQAEEQRKEMQKRSCSHSSFNAATGIRRHQWRAQVHTPAGEKPYFQPMCTQCWTLGPKILATTEMLTNGVNLDQYADIDLARLELWAKQMEGAA